MLLSNLGSPPQVRGKHTASSKRGRLSRITPAGAGKTCYLFHWYSGFWDHPRRCGENLIPKCPHIRYLGSPPQVRGKHISRSQSVNPPRITPAGAVKTHAPPDKNKANRDHPRRCGENLRYRFFRSLLRGSPPQVRGKPRDHPPLDDHIGITPAGAGKTFMSRTRGCTAKDHPRRCGENQTAGSVSRGSSGSPPQVRGKRFFCAHIFAP